MCFGEVFYMVDDGARDCVQLKTFFGLDLVEILGIHHQMGLLRMGLSAPEAFQSLDQDLNGSVGEFDSL